MWMVVAVVLWSLWSADESGVDRRFQIVAGVGQRTRVLVVGQLLPCLKIGVLVRELLAGPGEDQDACFCSASLVAATSKATVAIGHSFAYPALSIRSASASGTASITSLSPAPQ